MENIATVSPSWLFITGLLLGVSLTVAVIASKAWHDAKQELDSANFRLRRIADKKEGV